MSLPLVGTRWWLVLPGLALFLVAAFLFMPTGPSAAPLDSSRLGVESGPCRFKFDMRMLRTHIVDTVGDCVENERFNPESGDVTQRTTGGLMVRRSNDRTTAFTDGARTWVDGPSGIQVRGNNERFPWEVQPTPATTPEPTISQTAVAAAASQRVSAAKPIILAGAGEQRAPTAAPTVAPTVAPTPAPAAAPRQSLGSELADAILVETLRSSGLPLTEIQALTPDSDPEKLLGRPGQYTSRIVFKDQRAPRGDAALELFPDANALKARTDALAKAGVPQHVFANPTTKMLMRVPKELTPDQARSYEVLLSKLKVGGG